MMPNKLYIPTSTLNFNNIMSSESISPASFYLRRGFGYKRFEKVGPNLLDNRIILYREFPVFEINDNEIENYPLVIEIDSRYVTEDLIKENNGIYFSEETIYLNPFTTKFIFRNSQERISTVSKAEPSIETKMVSLYEQSFCIISNQKDIKCFNWKKTDFEDSKNDISPYISKDRKINKLKGLLYAYLIGSNKSVSSDIVTMKKLSRSLKNTLSAVMTSPDGRATYSQEEQLKSIYKSINERLQKIFISPIIKEKSELYQCDFFSVLIQENLWESWLRQNNYSKFQVSPFYVSSKDKDNAFSNYILKMENQILNIEYNQKKSKADISCLPILQNNRVIEIPEKRVFLTKLYNEYLEEAYSSEEFIQSRYEFAKSGGKIFKDELQDNWNGSQWQQYINGLLKNLNEHSAFDIKSIKNITLESFAALCQKGESDIDKLEDYLITNEISDFRIAFSLWGIIFGFANMPKTLTNDLFLSDDLDYVSNVYKFIFKQLHGIELNGTLVRKNINEYATVSSKIIEEQPLSSIMTNDITVALVQDLSVFEEYTSRDKTIQKEIITKLNEKEIYSLADWNDKKVDSIKWSTSKGQKKLMSLISKSKNKSINKKQPLQPKETTLFNPQPEKEFYKDANVGSFIEKLLPTDKKSRNQFKIDLDWFQDEYKKGESSQYYAEASKENIYVIEAYGRYLKKKSYANKLDIGQITSILKELYK